MNYLYDPNGNTWRHGSGVAQWERDWLRRWRLLPASRLASITGRTEEAIKRIMHRYQIRSRADDIAQAEHEFIEAITQHNLLGPLA